MQRALSPNHSPPQATIPSGTDPQGHKPQAVVWSLCRYSKSSRHHAQGLHHPTLVTTTEMAESPTILHASFRTSALHTQTPRATLRLRAHLLRHRKWERKQQHEKQPCVPRPSVSSVSSDKILSSGGVPETSVLHAQRLQN